MQGHFNSTKKIKKIKQDLMKRWRDLTAIHSAISTRVKTRVCECGGSRGALTRVTGLLSSRQLTVRTAVLSAASRVGFNFLLLHVLFSD